VYANSAASRIFHLGELPPRGKRLTTLPRIPQLLTWAQQVISTRQGVSGRITLLDERTLQAYVTPFESTPPGFVVLARDITDTISLENSRRDFIAGVSHELRTPLTSIQGYTELLMQDDDMPLETRRQFLEVILSNTGRLTNLAQDLVTLSSIETGTYPFHFQLMDARTLPGPAIEVLLPRADERQCEILLEEFEPGQVRVDPDAMHRVLLNLIDNAIVHGGNGIGIYLSGAVRGPEYEITVRDTGIGIGTMDQPRVFERFYRVDKSHSRLGGGSGLGLALVKHIIREHGGHIELTSGLGKGTTFRLRLPLVSAQEAASTHAGEVESS
jgi:two-component system phosphate regulon sensor histidine kinase PhoR